MSTIPVFVVEAFTKGANEAYTGNTAGVIFLEYDDDVSDEAKQKIASTINLPTTAFIAAKGWMRSDEETDKEESLEVDSKNLSRTIRWFTPTTEIQLCGHATFAAMKVLSTVFRQIENVNFESRFHGTLVGNIERGIEEGEDLICLDFPESHTIPIAPDTPWLDALTKIFLGTEDTFAYVGFSKNVSYLMLILKRKEDEDPLVTITRINPKMEKLLEADVGGLALDGFSVSIQGRTEEASDDKTPNCYSRQFAPQMGINEDYVCGSMHTMVISYWTNVLNLHGTYLTAHQASPRGGDLRCIVMDGKVKLCGRGRIVSEGKLNL